jgi:hypothetical protein
VEHYQPPQGEEVKTVHKKNARKRKTRKNEEEE